MCATQNGLLGKRVKVKVGMEIYDAIVVKENDKTIIVELYYDYGDGEEKTGKTIKRHKEKHIVNIGDDDGKRREEKE